MMRGTTGFKTFYLSGGVNGEKGTGESVTASPFKGGVTGVFKKLSWGVPSNDSKEPLSEVVSIGSPFFLSLDLPGPACSSLISADQPRSSMCLSVCLSLHDVEWVNYRDLCYQDEGHYPHSIFFTSRDLPGSACSSLISPDHQFVCLSICPCRGGKQSRFV